MSLLFFKVSVVFLTIACRTHTATGQGSRKGRLSRPCSRHSSNLLKLLYHVDFCIMLTFVSCWLSYHVDFHIKARCFLVVDRLTCVEPTNSLRDNPLEIIDHRVWHRVGCDVSAKKKTSNNWFSKTSYWALSAVQNGTMFSQREPSLENRPSLERSLM